MQTQNINEMLNLSELKIHQILSTSAKSNVAVLWVGSLCHYKGSNGMRIVRHSSSVRETVHSHVL